MPLSTPTRLNRRGFFSRRRDGPSKPDILLGFVPRAAPAGATLRQKNPPPPRRHQKEEIMANDLSRRDLHKVPAVAGNGLLDRRVFLRGGAAFAAAITGYTVIKSAAAEPLVDAPWSRETGAVTPALQTPSRFEKAVTRTLSNPKNETRTSHGRTPHHLLNGTFTPNSVHFTINHSGIPDIDPAQHRLVI